MASEDFGTPGQCCTVTDCEVALVLKEEEGGPMAKLYACPHKLASLSQYFDKLLYGNFKERNKKEVNIKGVKKKELLPFVRWVHQHPKPLEVKDLESLCSLIVLADRFLCPTLEEQILAVLTKESVFESRDTPGISIKWHEPIAECIVTAARPQFGVDAKLKLVEVAENHKGTDAKVLEACVRRCADLEVDRVAPLHGKVSGETLAAVYATIGRAKGKRQNPIEFSEIKRIKVNKDLLR